MWKRMVAIAALFVVLTLQGCVSSETGLKNYADTIDGYTFDYPNGWIEVETAGQADIVFRDLIQETENVSVVVSPISGDRDLADLGDPKAVANAILTAIVAPQGDQAKATLVDAAARTEGENTYYRLDYSVSLPMGDRHNLASAVVRRGKLFTLNISAPEARWERVAAQFAQVVDSFSVF